ncbi:5029_t:CDS:2, partial [Entrophospora sp. SA101]
ELSRAFNETGEAEVNSPQKKSCTGGWDESNTPNLDKSRWNFTNPLLELIRKPTILIWIKAHPGAVKSNPFV